MVGYYGLANVNSVLSTYDPVNQTLNILDTLDYSTYGQNKGSLMQASNGHMNKAVTKRHSFSVTDGIKPYYDKLTIVDFTILSTDETSLLNNNIKIFPIPGKDIINVSIKENNQFLKKILDLKGSELFIDNSKSNEYTVNTYFLSPGVYLLYKQIREAQQKK